MNKVLVTGCAGFIGSNLTKELLERGYEVVGIDNLSTGENSNMESFRDNRNFKFIQDDIGNRNLSVMMEGVDTIFHLAALARIQPSITNPESCHNVNVDGTFNVLMAARNAGVRRVVFSSSSSIYGIQDEFPEVETADPNPSNPYAASKQIGEIYTKIFSHCYGVETVNLRYFNVYGFNQATEGAYATVIGIFLKQIDENNPMTIVGDGTKRRDFTWVGDVVEANIKAMLSDKVGKGEIINIGKGQDYSINEVAGLISGESVNITDRPFEARKTLASIGKAKELLDWEPKVSLEMGISLLKKEQNARDI